MAEIILALDLPNAGVALPLVAMIPPSAWIKIGSVLFTAEGPSFVRKLKDRGHPIFLDLKWHDIPHTVEEAVRAATSNE